MSQLFPKNWTDFQHYKDRSPPWIRLHKSLLDNYEFQRLPVASRALAPMLWLLASESSDLKTGGFDGSPEKLAFRLRMSEQEVIDALKPLIDGGFFELEQNDSIVLAPCLHDAVPETETETETDSPPVPSKRSGPIEIKTFLENCKLNTEKPIPENDPVFAYAEETGIPHEFLRLAWREFVERSSDSGKRYRDWRKAFRNCIRGNWYKLWWCRPDGDYELTTTGVQAQRKHSGAAA